MKQTRKGLWTTLALGAAAVTSLTFTLAFTSGPDDKDNAKDAAKETEAAKVGDEAPDFTLTDLDGKEHKLSDLVKEGKTVVLEWFNPDCPYVKKYYENRSTMNDTAEKYADKKVVWLAINSANKDHFSTGQERNEKAAKDFNMDRPILLDYEGTVGRAYGAKTTPQIVIIHDGKIVFNGALDSSLHKGDEVGETKYVENALDQCLAGETVEVSETKHHGCSVKYKSKA